MPSTYSADGLVTTAAEGESLPALAMDVAFATDPTETPVWTDVSAYLQGFSSRRGRAHEWDRIAAGTATAWLNNQARTFDPTYAAGTYSGQLLPLRRARLRAGYAGRTYDVWDMYARGWPQAWDAHGTVARVPLELVDGFHVLARKKLNETYSQELSSERIKNVLDDANWGSGQAWVLGDSTYGVLGTTTILGPTGDREIGVGASQVQGVALAGTTALEHLLAVAFDNEQGRLFMGKNGAVVFQGRHLAIKEQRYTTSQATWGDAGDGTELPYADLELDYDESLIENEVRLQRVGGSVQTATDATSQGRYYTVTHERTDLLLTTDGEVASAANWRLSRRKEPAVRVVGMAVNPSKDPAALWPVVLGAEIGDRWTVVRRPPGGGDAITQESFIEGIAHDARPGAWTVRFTLAPADTATYWVLGDSTASVLGSTTRIAW